MKILLASSGDLVVDRRASYAEMLFAAGDAAAAVELMRDTLALAPAWAAGWFRLGEMLEAAGRLAEATDAWRETLRLDPDDRFGATLKLELAGCLAGFGVAPSRFVETLFDQYAETFDAALIERLAYRGPELLSDAIVRTGRVAFAHALDLGCGTGLMGERLRAMTSFLEGCDISAGMIAKASAKGVYDRLERRDLQSLEAPTSLKVDLVTAADVFIYLGRLERIVATIAETLSPGGLFAFSVERHDGPEDLVLRPSRRYAHSGAYVRALLTANGFEIASIDRAPLRLDRAEPIEALVVVAKLPVSTRSLTAAAETLNLEFAEQELVH